MTSSDKPEEASELAQTILDLEQSKEDGINMLGGMLERYGCRIRSHIKKAGAASSDVDDLEQEVNVKLLEALPKANFETVGQFRKWVQLVATNRTIDFLRRKNGEPGSLESLGTLTGSTYDPPAKQSGMPTQIDRCNSLEKARDLLAKREAAIAKLRDPMRELVEMREKRKLTFAEIAAEQTRKAKALGIDDSKTEDSVRVAYNRILERLGEPLDDSGLSAMPDPPRS